MQIESKNDRSPESTEHPLFVRFLEGQNFPQVRSDVRAGKGEWPPPNQTMKAPSDNDED